MKKQKGSSKEEQSQNDNRPKKRGRKHGTRLFPACSFEEALAIPLAIQKLGVVQKVRRLTLFDHIGKSPESGASRQMIANASRYGLIKGSHSAENLELTNDGKIATSAESSVRDKLTAQFKLAIERIPPFKALYDSLKNNRLPAHRVLEDMARENGVAADDVKECIDIFIVNAKYLGILKPIAGAERIIPIEQTLEEYPVAPSKPPAHEEFLPPSASMEIQTPKTEEGESWEKVCFYISPIGDEGSDQRNHSDLFLGSIVEPALEEFSLKVVRADRIGKPGMITAQVIQYILRSHLVIADLSFHNPNVFYELSLRHACRLPTVQIIRKVDRIPFDLDQFRTIQIDTSNIYTMVPNLQTYKAEIANQVRTVLKDPDSVDNPISTYYPDLKVQF
ncbi:MAG: hypothetical protein ACE144_20015 [Thermodesulfobacteriota bacterium]